MSHPDLDTRDLPPDPPSGGEPVTLFYDCEFTDLTPDSDLLSIGFVASDFSHELYIELLDAEVRLSSDFVRSEVIPLFGKHNPEVLTRAAAAVRIEEWLDDLRDGDRSRQIVALSDSAWDWQHLLELFVTMPGTEPWARTFNVVGRMVHSMLGSGSQIAVFDQAVEAYHQQHNQRHHALVDARALKTAFWESRLS
jgi:hypothetical protein